jgi:hypothetical protein
MPEFMHFGLSFDEPCKVRELLARLRADDASMLEEGVGLFVVPDDGSGGGSSAAGCSRSRVVGGAALCSWVTDRMSALLLPGPVMVPVGNWSGARPGLNARAMRAR